MLTTRQELVLRKVIEEFLDDGVPVGSKALTQDDEIQWGSSTVRNELALLEEHGLLAHPHTSAGRIPTDSGYRYFVDRLLPERQAEKLELELDTVQRELDVAMRTTVETLSQVTDLLAIVSAPPIDTTTIRHVEVLLLQPTVLMVVVITSSGGVTKRLFTFENTLDRGLIEWANSYLNEQLVGLGLGARMLNQRLSGGGLEGLEASFIARLAPAFLSLDGAMEDTIYVDGTSRLLTAGSGGDLADLNSLVELLEHRVNLLQVIKSVLADREFVVSIGSENEVPALRSFAMVSAGYGLPRKQLGAISVIGPVRMDYAEVIASVRGVAHELSRFVGEVYEV